MAAITDDEVKAALDCREFIFENVIGKGSFGVVIRVMHKVTQSRYAVKVMPIINSDIQSIKYQKRELDLLTTLGLSDNGNVIRYFDSWLSKKLPILCIQMELCLLTLHHYICIKNGLCSPSVNIVKNDNFYKHVFPQILNGLHTIHSVGWVHRDIHPGNILIANPEPRTIQDIVIKIADFGLARHIGPVINSSTNLSVLPKLDQLSPFFEHSQFRAPELSTQYYDYKVDLYSAGIVLYILCRSPLQNANQWNDDIWQLRQGKCDKNLLCHQDEILIWLLDKLLNTNPADRPTADVALKAFQTDGVDAKTEVNFLAKKKGEDSYNRCCATDDSLSEIKETVERVTGIRKENLVLHQETNDIVNGEKILVNINNDKDAKEMFKSAEKAGSKVFLIYSEKDAPGAEDQIPEC